MINNNVPNTDTYWIKKQNEAINVTIQNVIEYYNNNDDTTGYDPNNSDQDSHAGDMGAYNDPTVPQKRYLFVYYTN